MELLDSKTLIKKFHGFFEEYKKNEIKKAVHEGGLFLPISFFEISEFDVELGDQLLFFPEDVLKLMEETLKQFQDEESKIKLRVRLTSLPDTERVHIRNIRSEHRDRLVLLEGIVVRKTPVRPRLQFLEYLCTNPSCSNSQTPVRVAQIESKARTLKVCPKCKSQLERPSKVLVDSQSLVLGENPEHMENSASEPQRINILLQDDLVSPFKDSKTNPGSKVYVIGMVKEVPLTTATGAESVNYDLIVDANYIDLSSEDYSEINISKEEEKDIKELSAREDVYEKLVESFAPSIYGNNKVKEAILLQLFGGSGGIKGDGIKTRGDIHVLLIGDPGAAKSQMLKAATAIAPKSVFVSGKSTSGVGLTAAVLRDDLTKGWALEAGAMVLASGGLCAIDELDKMSDEDTSAMHEGLEQQSISVAKANIRATLRCQTTVLGAANPRYGRFDPYGDIPKQINFPPALLSRFDLIFILRDEPDKKRDDLIADHILQTHRDKTKSIAKLPPEFMKKYIAYARPFKPVLTQDAIVKIKDFYISIRNAVSDEEGQARAMPITARQLEAIVRLAEAYAKVELSRSVKVKHADKAIDLLLYCLKKIGVDPKTGEIDIDRITTGVSSSTRNMFRIVQQIIDGLEKEHADIKYEMIVEEASKINLSKIEVDKVLEKLKQEGLIFEPRKNIFKKLL